jgi:hypothetical protein
MPMNVEARISSPPATTDDDWPVQAADTIDRVVTTIRSKTADPLILVARWIVFGMLAFVVGTMTLILVAIGAVRALIVYLPVGDNRVWVALLIVGGIFVLAGLLLFRAGRPRDER